MRARVADSLWYKDAVIYEVHVRAFRDSDGNGDDWYLFYQCVCGQPCHCHCWGYHHREW